MPEPLATLSFILPHRHFVSLAKLLSAAAAKKGNASRVERERARWTSKVRTSKIPQIYRRHQSRPSQSPFPHMQSTRLDPTSTAVNACDYFPASHSQSRVLRKSNNELSSATLALRTCKAICEDTVRPPRDSTLLSCDIGRRENQICNLIQSASSRRSSGPRSTPSPIPLAAE